MIMYSTLYVCFLKTSLFITKETAKESQESTRGNIYSKPTMIRSVFGEIHGWLSKRKYLFLFVL